jgi:hypothetical protein
MKQPNIGLAMRETKIKGRLYRYDPETGKMVEIKREAESPGTHAFRYHWVDPDGAIVWSDDPPPEKEAKC